MNRLWQIVLCVSFLAFAWLALQAIHEAGHAIGAAATGGKVVKVVLHPTVISRTDVEPNPQPLLVVWAGPVFGALAPVAAWIAACAVRLPGAFYLRGLAGFCLIGNGAYLGAGAAFNAADAADLLCHGAMRWQLFTFATTTVAGGLALWHGQGCHFGLARRPREQAADNIANTQVRPATAIASLAACLVAYAVAWFLGSPN